MAGFDELIERLLYDIALAGSHGFFAEQFERVVRDYYEEKNASASLGDNANEDDLLFSSAPPAQKTTVDEGLLGSVLEWLAKHPDVDIQDVEESEDRSTGSDQAQSSSSTWASSLAGKRIVTSKDRVWQAIADHGVDHKRLPKHEFAILSVVAAHGSTGILQPDVTRITGQDKRSVPKRTDLLAEKGYIIKENVVGAGARTSNLKLKRYANNQALQSTTVAGPTAGAAGGANIIHYDAWFNITIRVLKENDNIVAVDDLRLHLGLNAGKHHDKILRRCVRHLAETGCIRCVNARLQDANGNPVTHPASGKEKKTQSIQLLREPTEFDRIKWAQPDSRNSMPNEEVSDDEAKDDVASARPVEAERTAEVEDDQDDLDLLKERMPPQWTPDLPIVNQVYTIVEAAGQEGISSMDLANRLAGPAWRRPMDQIMLLLTEVGEHSQPPHLKHLSIVRDTSVHGKFAHYRFRTRDNFQKAVNAGNASWEAVSNAAKTKGKNKATEPGPVLDEWGFPVVPSKELATLEEKSHSEDIDHVSDDERQVETEQIAGVKRRAEHPLTPGEDAPEPKRPRLITLVSRATSQATKAPMHGLEGQSIKDQWERQRESPAANGPFNARYVDDHPDETFYHRGRGSWVRGIPPEGSTSRTAVRGPGAEAWKASVERPSQKARPADSCASLIVRLQIPRQRLLALASRSAPVDGSTDVDEEMREAIQEGDDSVPRVDDSMDVDEEMEDIPILDVTQASAMSNDEPSKSGKKPDKNVAHRDKIILDTISACDGVFPGNGEMSEVFLAAWKRLYNQSPAKVTVDKTLKVLMQTQKLKRLQFQFRGKGGLVVQRAILTEPDVDSNSALVKKMQKRIIDSYPSGYLPPEVEVDDKTRAKISKAPRRRAGVQPVANEPEHQAGFGEDESLVVRRTKEASAVEMAQARQHGFSNVAAYRQHIHEEAKAKSAASRAKATAQNNENAASDDEKRKEISKADQSVRKLPPMLPIPALPRKPLSSLRPTTRPKKKSRRPRDLEGGMALEDEIRHRLRGAGLLHHPSQAFHETSGTFSTSSVVPVESTSESRTPRNRVVVPNGYTQHRLVYASSNVPLDLVNLLSRADSLGQTDTAQQFYQEVNTVQAWEEEQDRPVDAANSNQLTFINHTLDQPHVCANARQTFQTTTIPAPTVPHSRSTTQQGPLEISSAPTVSTSLGPQTLITPNISKRTGKGKRKYNSRKTKNFGFGDAAQGSDSDYVPDVPERPSPERKRVKARVKGKDITSRDRKSGAEFKDGQRLVAALALITTICGGIHPDRPPWSIIAHALSFRYEGDFLRRRWDNYKRYRGGDMESLRTRIREAFLTAYERDELPPLDFGNLSDTDWPALLRWVEAVVLPNVAISERPDIPDLLQSKDAVEQQFIIQEQTPVFRFNTDEFFMNLTDIGRKHYALRYTHGIPLPATGLEDADDMAVLKSWVRAITMTRQWNYDANAAASKLSSVFSTAMLEKVVAEMIENKIFTQEKKGRQLPGRNFIIHNDVLAQFKRWPAKPEEHQYLRQVARAWTSINQHFQVRDRLELVAEASDPEYIALTNMVAQGQLKAVAMLPPRKDDYDAPFPKLSPWGYGGANYETKKVNPASLKAPVVYVKTLTYQPQHGLTGGVPIPTEATVKPGEKGARVPFWVDIHGNVIEDIWDMVLRSLIHLLVFRPGTIASRMQEWHNHKFWDWEIELALDWMEKSGIAVRCGAGGEKDGIWKGGWRAGDWWYCAFVPDVATWQAPAGAEIGV